MKRDVLFFVFVVALAFPSFLWGQKYEIKIVMEDAQDSVIYMARHFRDGYVFVDSAVLKNGNYTFKAPIHRITSPENELTGIYALVDASKKKNISDFTIDGTLKFSLSFDKTRKPEGVKVKGCIANKLMFDYMARNSIARAELNQIEQQKKSNDSTERQAAQQSSDSLTQAMIAYQDSMMAHYARYFYFFRLQKDFEMPDVPDSVQDKAYYFRSHYWDNPDLKDHRLIYTPELFQKMNYYFFGRLYHSDADTICKYADLVLDKIATDSIMMHYFLDFIMPRYYKSTKNIGWDQVWCHLVRRYYEPNLGGIFPKSEVANKVKQAAFLEKSLIGAPGAELLMADTNQSPNIKDWISSHRQPYKYVILWFWDPDCHHCQEQTATLKTLYDSLTVAGTRQFEVYAVGYESDVEKWKRYVKEHELPFINVGGPNVNIDYQEAYNVHGAPTMIILNEERRIIMNKTLPTSSILPFLLDYEKKRK